MCVCVRQQVWGLEKGSCVTMANKATGSHIAKFGNPRPPRYTVLLTLRLGGAISYLEHMDS